MQKKKEKNRKKNKKITSARMIIDGLDPKDQYRLNILQQIVEQWVADADDRRSLVTIQ